MRFLGMPVVSSDLDEEYHTFFPKLHLRQGSILVAVDSGAAHREFDTEEIKMKEKNLLSILLISILQDHLIDNFSTDNAPPSKKISIFTGEFFVNHGPIASMTFHGSLPHG